MSTLKSSAEDLTLNADGSGNDIKFQSNAVEKASLSDAGLLTTSGGASLDGVVTINETGADVDFRVEGSGEANALFVQGSDGAVGIGTGSPAKTLDVVGDIRTSTGILFGTDTAAANTLSDYETGVFDPTFTTTGSGSATLGGNTKGFYTKVGATVNVIIAMQMGTNSFASGNLQISGLPFTSGTAIGVGYTRGVCTATYLSVGTAQPNTLDVPASGTTANVWEFGNNNSYAAADFDDGGRAVFGGLYITDS